ncbi:hypothetical protein BGX38DRAFT_884387 [Terfezia claveryi]|nr:hypothetical protein BGX38DRAFT_884387 [Terfezia claveryi]
MPLPSKRGISNRPGAQQQLSSALSSTQTPTAHQQETESQLLREQKIPNPLPPVPFGRQNTRTPRLPLSLPDYEHDNQDVGMGDEDIIVYGSDEQAELGHEAEIEKFRDERLRRVHTYAQRYLAGDRVYIHCARLKGPVVNNPWKKRKEHNDHEQIPLGMREFKRRRLMDEKEDEVMATPTQSTRTTGTETVENCVSQEPGPRRKRAAPKKVVHGEEEDEVEVEEEEEEEEEEEDLEGGELDTISVPTGKEELHTITVASIGRRKRKSTTAGKLNPQKTTGMGMSKTKPKSRTTTSRNSSKACTTTTTSKKTVTTSKRRKAEALQEEAVEEATVTVKFTRGRGEGRGGRGGRGGRISTKSKAPITQHADDKDEGGVSGASSIRMGKRKAPASVNKAKWGNHISPTVSGQTTLKSKKAQPETMNQSTEPAMEQPLEATVAATTTNFWEKSFEIPAVDPAEPLANSPVEPITPVANLSLEEPTPPSIFYGPSSTSKNGVTGSAKLANRFIAVKRGTSNPVAKQTNSQARTIPVARTKSKRAGSASAVAVKKTGKKTADGAAAVDAPNAKRKQKVTVALAEEEGNSSERQEGGDNDLGEWVPTSSDFKYIKGNGMKSAVVDTNDDLLIDGRKAGKKEEIINKGKSWAMEVTATQQPKRKKPRVIDFSALSPFGGGQVVTKGGRAYSSQRGDLGDEGKGAAEPRADRKNAVGLLQTGKNVSVAPIAPSLNTSSGKPTSSEKGYSFLREVPDNTNSQGNINESLVAVNEKAAFVKESTRVAPTVGQPSGIRWSITLSKEVDQAAQAAGCTTCTAIHGEVLPVPALGTLGEEPQPTEPFEQVEELVFAVPPPPTAGLELQSPWMNTQRQLSAARKGFMSLLDTPTVEETIPAKMQSTALSRLRRGPDFGLERSAGAMETPSGNPLSTTLPGSIVLMPETPGPILAGLSPDPAVEDDASSGAGVVPDTSPSGPTTSRHRGESTTTPATLSAFRTRNGADVTFSSPMAVRGDIIGDSHSEGATQRDSIPPLEFSPFKTFDTPTKSQFGNFIPGFSPLRYSPDGALGMVEGPQLQSTSEHRSQSQSSMVPIRLFGGDKPKDPRAPEYKPRNQQRVNPSTWLGLSQSRTSNISLFDSSAGTPAQQSAPPSSPALPSSPPPRSLQAHTPPPILPLPPFSPSQEKVPGTPHFRRASSTQFTQNGQQSPGTKLAGDMLEMMGGGVWDIDTELNKMRSEDTQAEAEGPSKKNALATPTTGRGKLSKGLFNSGTRRVGSGKRRL